MVVLLDSIRNLYDDAGYHYITMSPSWRSMCLAMPCSSRVVIPPVYAQQSIDVDGLVIQAWKGYCPHAPGLPGGIGGEVGVYRRDPARSIGVPHVIPDLHAFPKWQRPFVKRAARWVLKRGVELAEGGIDHWWPNEIAGRIAMSFAYDDHLFFTAEQTGGYWLSRWMTLTSYVRFAATYRHVPTFAKDFEMRFSVGDRDFVWRDPDSKIEAIA